MKKLSKIQKLRNREKAYRKKFNEELKKTISTAVIAAFGFIIALSWKEVITEYVKIVSQISPFKGRLIEAIIITIVSVIGILIITRIFSKKE